MRHGRPERPADDASPEEWLVHADALQEQDDPSGALIALNHGVATGADPARRDAYLRRHATAILGPLAPHMRRIDIAWHYGVPETISLRIGPADDGSQLVSCLVESPLAPWIRRLRLVAVTPRDHDRVDLSGAVTLLATRLPASCGALELVDERARTARRLVNRGWDPAENLVSIGSLDAVWAIRHLRSLRLDVADADQLDFGTIDAPALTSLEILPLHWPTPRVQSAASAALASARWPSLRRLSLRLPEAVTYQWTPLTGAYAPNDRYDEEKGTYLEVGDSGRRSAATARADWATELGPVLAALHTTRIEQLSLTAFLSGSDVLEALRLSGLPSTLRHLDLSGSNLHGGDVEWLLRNRDLFARLETLDLRSPLIQDPPPLGALGPNVLHTPGIGSVYQFSIGME